MAKDALSFGPLTRRTVHLCIDMQRLFAPGGIWSTPWMDKVLPAVTALAAAHPRRTLFTRFIPPADPAERPGTWRRFYERWRAVTLARLDPGELALMPPLQALVPPAEVIDKPAYSAFTASALDERLQAREADALIVSGAETDVCVLATVLGAVDRGYRVILVTDALCSSSDLGHDALIAMYRTRYSQQIETATAAAVLAAWPG